ncbi:MAG: hypothetical protein RXP99_04320 [Vulcanisaeta sp.]|jgi:hypothetical protein|nr:hypothetical protein [Vulcanisaeta sp.]MCG2886320.1 hypothetical protein [Vulcanisaeta sp.]
MELSGDFRIVDVKGTGFRGIVRLEMEDATGVSLALEYPRDVLGIDIKQGDNVRVSISNSKDPNYSSNWDVYMNGVVYYVSEGLVKVSIGGLILDIRNYKGEAKVGEKVYIGLKLIK